MIADNDFAVVDRKQFLATQQQTTQILGFLLAGEEPPPPDFAPGCPMLGAQGCRLPAAHRPFNCVIFLCVEVERHLTAGQRDRFATIEAELRRAVQHRAHVEVGDPEFAAGEVGRRGERPFEQSRAERGGQ